MPTTKGNIDAPHHWPFMKGNHRWPVAHRGRLLCHYIIMLIHFASPNLWSSFFQLLSTLRDILSWKPMRWHCARSTLDIRQSESNGPIIATALSKIPYQKMRSTKYDALGYLCGIVQSLRSRDNVIPTTIPQIAGYTDCQDASRTLSATGGHVGMTTCLTINRILFPVITL